MRTYTRTLVQIAALALASVTVAAAADYGAPRTPQHDAQIDSPAPAARSPAPSSRASSHRVDTPPRGMSMDRVIAVYGMPRSRQAAVGDPPITRWDYPDYRLYFESNHVLHAVVPGHPVPVDHVEQLDNATAR